MRSHRENPEGEENQRATRENNAEVARLQRQQQLVEAWAEAEEIEPAERLLEKVSQRTGADVADVAEALYRSAQKEET